MSLSDKCALCGKPSGNHNAMTKACPYGRKHRSDGYTAYHPTHKFTPKKPLPFWIKERQNPQLGTYFIACGQHSKAKAKRMEKSLYGFNTMHEFPTEQAYSDRLTELRAEGASIQ